MLDPQANGLLKLMLEYGVPPVNSQSPQEARHAYLSRKGFSQPDALPVKLIRDHVLDLGSHQIKIREYRPNTPLSLRASPPAAKLSPALLYYHGGGWTIGDIETHDVLCRALSDGAGCAVFSVDYRLGPEDPFPAAFEDALAAFQWLLEKAQDPHFAVDPHRIAMGGDSAGGNLVASACIALKEQDIQPCFQLLIYPATDMLCSHPSHLKCAKGYLLTRQAIEWFRGNYMPDPQTYTDWRASPLLALNHEGLPPAFVLLAGFDPLHDEGLAYANKLSMAGVRVQVMNFERQIHGFITMGRILDEAHTAVDVCSSVLRNAFKLKGE
jgi:acetyl esterase